MRSLALVVLLLMLPAVAVEAAPSPLTAGARYLVDQQRPDGGFGEPGGASAPDTTAWAVLGLKAAGRDPAAAGASGRSPTDYLRGQPYPLVTDLAMRVLALDSLGQDVGALGDELEGLRHPDGRIGQYVNSTIWAVIALRGIGRTVDPSTVRYLLRRQRPNGGWSWHPDGAPDSSDTAAALQALRAAGLSTRSAVTRRGVQYILRHRNRDGGFALTLGQESNAQATAWAIQGLLAAGREPGKGAFAYLRRLQRPDGSFRLSAQYGVTPVWVTAQVLPALARTTFPLR